MKRFTDAGRSAIADSNLYAALSLALMMPDICGSLQDPGPGKSQKRYVQWCKRWLEPSFTAAVGGATTETVFLSAEDCFQLRCSLIHSGTLEIEPSKRKALRKAEFFDETTGNHCNKVNDWLQLRAAAFSETMFQAVEEWDASVTGDAAIQAEKEKLLVIHSAGVVIDDVKFG